MRDVQEAPMHWKEFHSNTLLLHNKAGEEGLDVIYYNPSTVHVMDVTVSTGEKILPADSEHRTQVILDSVLKWVGKDYYHATIQDGEIVLTTKATMLETAPEPPNVRFYIVSPFDHNFQAVTMAKYPFVRVISGQHLVKSGVFLQDDADAIANAFNSKRE
jgi:hypothetical protein